MPYVLVTAPIKEPLTIAEVKEHLRITADDEDGYIRALIKSARQYVETFTRRSLITQTWKLTLDKFPVSFELSKAPVQSVSSIKYYDTAGVQQTLSSSNYDVDTVSPFPRIAESYGNTWPTTRDMINAVEVEFVAGYGTDPEDVPYEIRQAMLMLCGHWYENRESSMVGMTVAGVSHATDALLGPFRLSLF